MSLWGGGGGKPNAMQEAAERYRRSEERLTSELRRERALNEAILSKHEDLKKLAGVAVAGAAVLAAGLGFAGARYALSRRVKQLSAQHDASLAAVQARGRELEQRAARSATRKLARSVVDSACDDLERIVAAEDPKVTMEHIREGVAMTQAGLHKVLGGVGVKPMGIAVGDVFDPEIHNAVAQVPADGELAPTGTVRVREVMREGYWFDEYPLRPAEVVTTRVNDGGADDSEPSAATQDASTPP